MTDRTPADWGVAWVVTTSGIALIILLAGMGLGAVRLSGLSMIVFATLIVLWGHIISSSGESNE